jgi:hypothetical protein
MPAPHDENKFDVRVLEQRLRRGVITKEEYAKYLASLPDDAANATETVTRFSDGFASRHGAAE